MRSLYKPLGPENLIPKQLRNNMETKEDKILRLKNNFYNLYCNYNNEDIVSLFFLDKDSLSEKCSKLFTKDLYQLFELFNLDDFAEFYNSMLNSEITKKMFFNKLKSKRELELELLSDLDKIKMLLSYVADIDINGFSSDYINSLKLDKEHLTLYSESKEYYNCININSLILDYKIGNKYFVEYLIDRLKPETIQNKFIHTLREVKNFKQAWASKVASKKLDWLFLVFDELLIIK